MEFAALRHASRFWPSDNTDALERVRIQSDASVFFPLNRIGSHVGASPNPTTGRRASMLLRSRVAMFAHMGVEADPMRLTAQDAEVLRGHIGLYKAHRALLHGGVFHAYRGDDPGVRVWLCVAQDAREAIGLAVRADQAHGLVSPGVRLYGLDDAASYLVTLPLPWPEPARFFLADPGAWRSPRVFSGELLSKVGLPLPMLQPETAWLFHLRRDGLEAS
jgi:alpha-galactosidase